MPARKHNLNGELLTAQQIADKYKRDISGVNRRIREGKLSSIGEPTHYRAPLIRNYRRYKCVGEYLTRQEIATKYKCSIASVDHRIARGTLDYIGRSKVGPITIAEMEECRRRAERGNSRGSRNPERAISR